MKDPQRNVPRALLLGILALTTDLPGREPRVLLCAVDGGAEGRHAVAERAATALVGLDGGRFVALTVVVSTFGCNAAAILAGARLLFAMARDGVMLPAAAACTRATARRTWRSWR